MVLDVACPWCGHPLHREGFMAACEFCGYRRELIVEPKPRDV